MATLFTQKFMCPQCNKGPLESEDYVKAYPHYSLEQLKIAEKQAISSRKEAELIRASDLSVSSLVNRKYILQLNCGHSVNFK